MKFRLSLFIFLFVLSVTETGVSTVNKTNDEIVVGLRSAPKTLDPQKMDDVYSMIVSLQIHRGLMRFRPNLEVAKDIAKSYYFSPSGKEVTFVLDDRFFSNRQPVQAIHVVRTFQRMFKDNQGSSADLNYIAGAQRILGGDRSQAALDALGVKAVDEKTVRFELTQPSGVFLMHLAAIDMAILPLDAQLKFDPVQDGGAGPYKIMKTDEKSISLERWQSSVNQLAPQRVHFKVVSTSEALAMANRGEIHCLDGLPIPRTDLSHLKPLGWRPTVSTLTHQINLLLNPKNIDAKTRQVIYNAIAQDDLSPKNRVRTHGLIPGSLAAFLKRSDIELTKSVPLAKRKTIKLTFASPEPTTEILAEDIRRILTPLGFNVEFNPIPMEQLVPTLKQAPYEMLLTGRFLDYPDGLSILTYFRSNAPTNTYFMRDPKIDRMIDQASTELDVERRLALYVDIQKKILNHHIVVPLVSGSDNLGLWHQKVAKVPAHPMGLQSLPFEEVEMRAQNERGALVW